MRKEYTTPRLLVYGRLTHITHVTADSERKDFSQFPAPNLPDTGSLDLCLTVPNSGVCVGP